MIPVESATSRSGGTDVCASASSKSSNLLNAPFFWSGLILADIPSRRWLDSGESARDTGGRRNDLLPMCPEWTCRSPERDRQHRRLILGRLRDRIAHAGCACRLAPIPGAALLWTPSRGA